MNNKKDIVKSFMTIGALSTLYVIIVYVFTNVKLTEDILLLVFTLFSNVITSIVTYYFTRKSGEK